MSEWFDPVQIYIMVMGLLAITGLGSRVTGRRKVGSICGMMAEPARLWVAIQNDSGGIIVLCLVFFVGYARAYRNNRWEFNDDRYTTK